MNENGDTDFIHESLIELYGPDMVEEMDKNLIYNYSELYGVFEGDASQASCTNGIYCDYIYCDYCNDYCCRECCMYECWDCGTSLENPYD